MSWVSMLDHPPETEMASAIDLALGVRVKQLRGFMKSLQRFALDTRRGIITS
jgi:hypothetical protein